MKRLIHNIQRIQKYNSGPNPFENRSSSERNDGFFRKRYFYDTPPELKSIGHFSYPVAAFRSYIIQRAYNI